MRKLIHSFKYGNKTGLRHFFGQKMLLALENYGINPNDYDYLIPIPLHSARLRERGYNQSLLIAEHLCEHTQIPILPNSLVRAKNTRNQASLNGKDRWTNIRGAFKIKHPSIVMDQSILLIDDLMTTGATISEASRILKESGAQKVDALSLAIA
jgi:ComF family protein